MTHNAYKLLRKIAAFANCPTCGNRTTTEKLAGAKGPGASTVPEPVAATNNPVPTRPNPVQQQANNIPTGYVTSPYPQTGADEDNAALAQYQEEQNQMQGWQPQVPQNNQAGLGLNSAQPNASAAGNVETEESLDKKIEELKKNKSAPNYAAKMLDLKRNRNALRREKRYKAEDAAEAAARATYNPASDPLLKNVNMNDEASLQARRRQLVSAARGLNASDDLFSERFSSYKRGIEAIDSQIGAIKKQRAGVTINPGAPTSSWLAEQRMNDDAGFVAAKKKGGRTNYFTEDLYRQRQEALDRAVDRYNSMLSARRPEGAALLKAQRDPNFIDFWTPVGQLGPVMAKKRQAAIQQASDAVRKAERELNAAVAGRKYENKL